jgi:hypothetical protein
MFDQQLAHNVNLLLRMVERNLPTLNRDALRDRKAKVITPEQAADYVASKHEMTIDDVRALRKEVADWRRIYEPVYRHIRDHLAHNKKGVSDLDALLAMTNVEEMKRMFGFFHALHEGLVELYLNGRNPLPLPDVTFVLPPEPKPQRQYHPGEKAHRTHCCRCCSRPARRSSEGRDRRSPLLNSTVVPVPISRRTLRRGLRQRTAG